MTDMRLKQRPAGTPCAARPATPLRHVQGWSRRQALGRLRSASIALGTGGFSVALLAAGGCVKKTSDIPKPDFNSVMTRMETDPDARLGALQKQSGEYAKLVHSLPGGTPQEDRDKISQAFGDLTQLLPLVQVGARGGVFNHQVMVVADTQTLLSGGSNDLSAAPIIDRGLRAVRNALDDAQHSGSVYYEDPALRATLDQLAAKIDDLDNARGALHDLAWAEAFTLSSDAISRMAAILADRLSAGATTNPTTGPTTNPTEAPSTTPAAPGPAEPAPPVATPAVAPTTGPADSGAAMPAAPATAPAEPGAAPATAPAEPATAPTSAPSP